MMQVIRASKGLCCLALLVLLLPGSLSIAEEERRFAKDDSRCPYLTRPYVEKCGARLNFHVGGQVLCHEQRVKHCFAGRWNDRGACGVTGDGFALASEFERSVFNSDIYESEGDDCDKPSGDSSGLSPDSGDIESGGAAPAGSSSTGSSALIGESPVSQQIEEEKRQLRDVRQRLEREDESKRSAESGPFVKKRSGASGTPNAIECGEMRRGLAHVDEQIRSLEVATRSVGADRSALDQLIGIRRLMQSKFDSEGCQ